MNKMTAVLAVLLVLILGHTPLPAQETEVEAPPSHKNERGFSFSLSSSGLGIGGFYRLALPAYTHLGFDLEFFAVRDDKEFEFVDPFTGTAFKINDANRLFLIPAAVELKKRLFANSIEDNFRPHVMLQAGAIYGMNFPQDVLINGETIRPKNQFEFTFDVLVGFGVDFSTRANFFATVRPQYRFVYFANEIAGKTNHSVFEIKFEIGGQR